MEHELTAFKCKMVTHTCKLRKEHMVNFVDLLRLMYEGMNVCVRVCVGMTERKREREVETECAHFYGTISLQLTFIVPIKYNTKRCFIYPVLTHPERILKGLFCCKSSSQKQNSTFSQERVLVELEVY